MSSPNIQLEGGFRTQILETVSEIKRLQAKFKSTAEELEQIAQSAASFQGVDLKVYSLDVDLLEFTKRPVPPQPEPVIEEPKFYPNPCRVEASEENPAAI
jgi:hypothetical protein